MAKYGNILMAFHADDLKKEEIKSILSVNGADSENFNEIFFIESNSKKNTDKIIAEIKKANVDFILFHNHISDGSRIESKGIEPSMLKRINKILIE